MVINSSNVSMASKNSYQKSVKQSQKLEAVSCIKFGNLVLRNDIDKLGKDDSLGETENNPLASSNYEIAPGGKIKSDDSSALENLKADKKVQNITMQYLFRLLFSRMFGDDMMSQMFQDMIDGGTVTTYTRGEISYEAITKEEVSFSSTGTAITADGRELNFEYSFAVSTEFKESYSESFEFITTRNLIDPLVINLDNNPTELSDQKFFFDLDCDGSEEEISQLEVGSGYLVFDRNHDGVVNDGNELFGVKSGDGFRDLSMYDEDGNGWIDENDSIFKELRVWTFDKEGNGSLHQLKDCDVGAIYLGKVKTRYDHQDSQNQLAAVTQSTGIFLHESTGRAGLVQHLDLAT